MRFPESYTKADTYLECFQTNCFWQPIELHWLNSGHHNLHLLRCMFVDGYRRRDFYWVFDAPNDFCCSTGHDEVTVQGPGEGVVVRPNWAPKCRSFRLGNVDSFPAPHSRSSPNFNPTFTNIVPSAVQKARHKFPDHHPATYTITRHYLTLPAYPAESPSPVLRPGGRALPLSLLLP